MYPPACAATPEAVWKSALTVTLSPSLDRFVKEKVQAEGYASADDFGMHALERKCAGDEVDEWVRACAEEGFAQLDAGASVEMTRHDFMQWLHQSQPSRA